MKIILVNEQEDSKKELKIIMVETKTLSLHHSIESGHDEVSESDFYIIGKGYRHHT